MLDLVGGKCAAHVLVPNVEVTRERQYADRLFFANTKSNRVSKVVPYIFVC